MLMKRFNCSSSSYLRCIKPTRKQNVVGSMRPTGNVESGVTKHLYGIQMTNLEPLLKSKLKIQYIQNMVVGLLTLDILRILINQYMDKERYYYLSCSRESFCY